MLYRSLGTLLSFSNPYILSVPSPLQRCKVYIRAYIMAKRSCNSVIHLEFRCKLFALHKCKCNRTPISYIPYEWRYPPFTVSNHQQVIGISIIQYLQFLIYRIAKHPSHTELTLVIVKNGSAAGSVLIISMHTVPYIE